MSETPDSGVDDFPCGCIIVDASRQLTFANRYMSSEFGWDISQIVGQRIETLISRGSQLFYDGYVYPRLLEKGKCLEIQLTIIASDGERVPVVANALRRSDGSVAWSLFRADERDKLFQEFVYTSTKLGTDDLTGLMNRSAFNQRATEMLTRCDQQGGQFAVLLMDLDNFKLINDRFGHAVGDEVLREVGLCLAQSCRGSDAVARFGGEEFVCAIDGADAEAAVKWAGRIHLFLKKSLSFDFSVTASFGIATRRGSEDASLHDMVNQADHAMYRAKREGKNRTVTSCALTAPESAPSSLRIVK